MDALQSEFLTLFMGYNQYVVPRWQRRYRWGNEEIERLIEDLLNVADAGDDTIHYGGTLLTIAMTPPVQGVIRYRVVDGQQRLTTISILLECIAQKLGPDGACGDWTAELIRTTLLTNPARPPKLKRKLFLQQGDEKEYANVLNGAPEGTGAVTQAWRTLNRIVARSDENKLMEGLARLNVVNIGLTMNEDPQQIFESLNATGRPLTESEKVKNWLLIGLPDDEQELLHDENWQAIEHALGATLTTKPIDEFLRDFLRWKTGQLRGIDKVYEGLRRWARLQGYWEDRPELCRELERLAKLYGHISGAAGPHRMTGVEKTLRHLRHMRIDVHRPFTLRLLNDLEKNDGLSDPDEVITTLELVNRWITRKWLADRLGHAMNRAFTDLACKPPPDDDTKYSEYWRQQINLFNNTRMGVPDDDAVVDGVRNRHAYGGGVTSQTKAVLYEIAKSQGLAREMASLEDLSVEHVMPQALTRQWSRDLGKFATEIHGKYRHRLANLTITGINPELGAKPFDEKKDKYSQSLIQMTRDLAELDTWDVDILDRRAVDLSKLALKIWPWKDFGDISTGNNTTLRWRLNEGTWRSEIHASDMVLNLASSLISLDQSNAQRLSGPKWFYDIQSAVEYPADLTVRHRTFRALPKYPEYTMNPYEDNYEISVERCKEMAQRCSVSIEIEYPEADLSQMFWNFLKENHGGVLGQRSTWRGPAQRTSYLNEFKDVIRYHIGDPDQIQIYVRATTNTTKAESIERMSRFSRFIEQEMSDQILGEHAEQLSRQGRSIAILKPWDQEDVEGWSEPAIWLKDQAERLETIVVNNQ